MSDIAIYRQLRPSTSFRIASQIELKLVGVSDRDQAVLQRARQTDLSGLHRAEANAISGGRELSSFQMSPWHSHSEANSFRAPLF